MLSMNKSVLYGDINKINNESNFRSISKLEILMMLV